MASLYGALSPSIMHEDDDEEHSLEGQYGEHYQHARRWQRTLLFSIGAALVIAGIVTLGAPILPHMSEGGPRLASLTRALFLTSSDAPLGAAADEEVFREVCMNGKMMFPNAEAVDQWIDIVPQIDAIKIFIDSMKGIPLQDLRAVVNKLNGKKILFDVEAGGIREWCCNSTALAQREFNKMRKFYQAGGRLSLWTMDGPFAHGLKTGRVKSCKYDSVETNVEMIIAYAKRLSELLEQYGYPPVVFGFNEPVPWFRVGKWESHPARPPMGDLAVLIPRLVKAFKEHNLELGFFHADHPSNYGLAKRKGRPIFAGGGYPKLKDLQIATRNAGLRFGKYFNNEKAGRQGDKAFYDATVEDLDRFVKVAGNPDNSIFESWYKHPAIGFPSDTDYTLSWDVAHFFPKRSRRSKWAIQLEKRLEQFEEAQSKKETG